jgi:hypothetical protein
MLGSDRYIYTSTFPDTIPPYFWQINSKQSIAQYFTWIATQFVPKQIWILCPPNMMPALREHVGEVCTYIYFSSRRVKFKKRNVHIPVYYWSTPNHMKHLNKREKAFQSLYLASRIHKSYSKIMLSGRINKFLFLDFNSIFDKKLLPQMKKFIRDKKNHLFKFKVKDKEFSFLNCQVPACLDIDQINIVLKYYNSIKTLDKKKISHRDIMSCIPESSFDSISTVELNHPLFGIDNFFVYAKYITFLVANKFSYLCFDKKSIGNISIKQVMLRKDKPRKCFIFSIRPIETSIVHEDGTRTPLIEEK